MIKKIFLSLCIVLYAQFCFAGSPGGLFLLVIPVDSAKEYKVYVDSYFKKFYGTDNELSPSCQVTLGSFNVVAETQVSRFYLKRRPEGINNELLIDALNNKKSAKKLKKLTGNYKDDFIEGFHAILFYDLVDNEINFYGLSTISDGQNFEKSLLPLEQIQDNEKLGLALCQVIAKLPVPEP